MSDEDDKPSKEEDPSKVEIYLKRQAVDLPDGTQRSILTCLDGGYIVWRDSLNFKRWRWAVRFWPDDDLGTSSHGAGTFRECVEASVLHFTEHHPGVQIPTGAPKIEPE